MDKYIQSILEEILLIASLEVIQQARFSALKKALAKSYQFFIRSVVVSLCKDMFDKKHEEAKKFRLQLRKFEKEEEARMKRELEARELKLK